MRKQELFWGVLLIVFGCVFLIGTITGANAWALLWPMFLIVAGAWVLWMTFKTPEALSVEALALPLEPAAEVRLKLSHGAGRLMLGPGASAGQLLEGTFAGGVIHKVSREGEQLRVKLSMPEFKETIPFFVWTSGPREWQIRLSDALPLALNLETGASDTRMELTALPVTSLKLGTGASSTEVWLPAHAGHTTVRVGAGAASVVLHVPEGVAARVEAKGGLASINVDQTRFPRSEGIYQSPDYELAANRAEISIETGVGSVEVQ